MSTDIAELGLVVRSDTVTTATDRLRDFENQAERADNSTAKLVNTAKGLLQLAAVAYTIRMFADGIKGAVGRLEDMRRMSLQVDQALKNSGNTARTSAQEISKWAEELEYRTGRAAEEVMRVSTNLATYGFGREEFYRALELANDMAAAWGGDLRSNVEALGRALDDPIQGFGMLSKRGVKLTDDQRALAEAFLNSNNKVAAQGVVFQALEAQVKGVAEAGFTGLERAVSHMNEAWEQAFEDMVRGTGETGDLRDTLVDLAETVSSPQFIAAVTGFANILIGGMKNVANAVVWAWGQMQAFLAWLNAQNPANQSSEGLEAKIAEQKSLLAKMTAPGNTSGWFGLPAAEADIDRVAAKIKELQGELGKRSDASQFDVNSTFNNLGNNPTYDSPEAMWRGLSPGTMFGQGSVDPYEGVDTRTDDAKKAAVKAAEELKSVYEGLMEDVKPLLEAANDPLKELQTNFDKLGALLNAGEISWQQYGDAVNKANLIAASSVLGSVGQITSILSGAFEDNKLLAAANAAINTAEGITKALAQGGMFAWPTAIAIGVAGAAQIASIMSASPGSASVSNVNAAQAAPTMQSQTAINLTIRGSGSVNVDELFEQATKSIADGGMQDFIKVVKAS